MSRRREKSRRCRESGPAQILGIAHDQSTDLAQHAAANAPRDDIFRKQAVEPRPGSGIKVASDFCVTQYVSWQLRPRAADNNRRVGKTLQLFADHLIDRVRPPTADRDGEHHDAEQKDVFEAALVDEKSGFQMHGEEADQELDRKRRREEARE